MHFVTFAEKRVAVRVIEKYYVRDEFYIIIETYITKI